MMKHTWSIVIFHNSTRMDEFEGMFGKVSVVRELLPDDSEVCIWRGQGKV